MIYTIEGFKTRLEGEGSIYILFSYNRLSLKPQERQIVQLPLRIWNPTKKHIKFELDKKLCLNGLQVLWTNLNEETSLFNIELLIYNSNLDYELLYGQQNPLSKIVGSNNKIDIMTETLLGRAFFS